MDEYETADPHSAGIQAVVDQVWAEARTIEITDEMVSAFGSGWHAADEANPLVKGTRRRAGLRAALEAAGFAVKADA
jgi:hypothetical protein